LEVLRIRKDVQCFFRISRAVVVLLRFVFFLKGPLKKDVLSHHQVAFAISLESWRPLLLPPSCPLAPSYLPLKSFFQRLAFPLAPSTHARINGSAASRFSFTPSHRFFPKFMSIVRNLQGDVIIGRPFYTPITSDNFFSWPISFP